MALTRCFLEVDRLPLPRLLFVLFGLTEEFELDMDCIDVGFWDKGTGIGIKHSFCVLLDGVNGLSISEGDKEMSSNKDGCFFVVNDEPNDESLPLIK